ncbi:hypothetical protein OH492_14600 [Vibrio chagasii]|nr:hypothetical protein [Vibrio chagasii]
MDRRIILLCLRLENNANRVNLKLAPAGDLHGRFTAVVFIT